MPLVTESKPAAHVEHHTLSVPVSIKWRNYQISTNGCT